MRCCCCNKNLNDAESVKKDKHGEYLDMCTKCEKSIDEVALTGKEDDVLPIIEDNDDYTDFDFNINQEQLDYKDDQ